MISSKKSFRDGRLCCFDGSREAVRELRFLLFGTHTDGENRAKVGCLCGGLADWMGRTTTLTQGQMFACAVLCGACWLCSGWLLVRLPPMRAINCENGVCTKVQ